jgi:DNA-binding response OmpR family regulator
MRLLLIEDNPADQELVRVGFRESDSLDGPAEVTVVESIDAARALLSTHAFDLILTDYSLPEQTGLDLLRALRESNDATPVVIMTGVADIGVAVTALQEGAADFVVKDIAFERALPVVTRRVLEKRAAEVERDQERTQLRERIRRLEQRLDTQSGELRRALQESEALRRVGQALAAGDPSAALGLVSKAASQMLQGQAAAVLLRHGPQYVLACADGPIKQSPGLKAADLPARLAENWPTVVSATMREGHETIGLLWVGRLRPEPFAPHHVEVLNALADLCALAIGKVRIGEQLRRLRDPLVASTGAADDDAPEGSEGSIEFPADAAAEEPEHQPQALDADAGAVSVLVVDDSEKVLAQARRALEASLTVLTATSGRQALETYASAKPAIVVIDLTMPDMDGFVTWTKLKELGCSAAIALTVRGDGNARELAKKAGFQTVVEKPFRHGELVNQVTAALTADSALGALVGERNGHPLFTLPGDSTKPMQPFIPFFLQRLRTIAEDGSDAMIFDASALVDITPDHVALLVRLFCEASSLGIRAAIYTPDELNVRKLRQILELRDADYVSTLETASERRPQP